MNPGDDLLSNISYSTGSLCDARPENRSLSREREGTMDDDRKQAVAAALNARDVRSPCPRCGARKFEILDETILRLERTGALVLGNQVIPVVVVACANCGFISLHASGILELMSESGHDG